MKKIFSFFTLLTVFILGLFFVSNTVVKATDINDGKTITALGASIRTADPSGLRFEGQVSEPFEGTDVSYGFVITKGTVTKNVLLERLAASSAFAIDAGELDGNNKFYVSVIDIPSSGYETNLTVLAYADVDGVIKYADDVITRNIKSVAQASIDGGFENEYIHRIVSTSTFNLNNGSFTYDYSFTITKSGDFGENVYGNGYYVMCASKANRGNVCSAYSEQFYIKKITNSKYYRVIATGTAPNDYDYVISIHSNCLDAASRNAVRGIINNFANMENYYVSFTAPSSKNCSVVVNVDRNTDKLAGNKIYCANGDALPTSVKRDYYTFDGWYDNVGLTGSAITNHSGDAAATYYAKWNTIEYTLSYDLQGGKCNGETTIDSESFTVESDAIVLPLAGTMSRTDYTFLGWYDNAGGLGSPITTIPAGSHDSITVYAVWEADLPVELALEAEDITVFNAEDVDIIVKSGLDGKYTLAGTGLDNSYDAKVYNTADGTAFTDLANAADYLNEHNLTGKKIYVFAGTYSTAVNLTKANTLVLGPNYNIDGDDTRNDEAIISGLVTITGANSTINGLKFTGDGAIKVSANYVTIDSIYSRDVNQIACNGNNRKGCIVDGANITNLTVKDSYINAKGVEQSYTTQFMSFTRVSTLTITNCYLTNEATTLSGSYRGMLVYNIDGVVNITNNIFAYATNGYVFGLGAYGSNTATEINIIDNEFRGRDSYNSATIEIQNGQKYLTTNIIHNQFYNFAPGTYNFSNDVGSRVYMLYNYHDSQKQYRTSSVGSAILYSDYNCYAGGIADNDASGAKTQAHSCASLAEVNTAYENLKTMYVNSSWSTHNPGDVIEVNGTNYTYGTNAFSTVSSALSAASVGTTINVLPGTYSGETLNITKSYIKLLGAYPTTSAMNADRLASNNETIINNSVITISKELTGVEICGLKFTGTSQVKNTKGTAGTADVPTTNLNRFNFSYNIVECGLIGGNGFISFGESGNSYSRDLKFIYNSFKHADGKSTLAMVYLDNLYNLNFQNNNMSNVNGDGLYVVDTSKGASGRNVCINNNEFSDLTGNAIHLNWISYLSSDSGYAIIESNNNSFNNVAGICIYYGNCNNTDTGYIHVQANDNTFTGAIGTPIKMNRVVSENKFQATGNTFASLPTSGYYVVNGMTGSSNKSIVATGNTYSAGNPSDSNFSGSVIY